MDTSIKTRDGLIEKLRGIDVSVAMVDEVVETYAHTMAEGPDREDMISRYGDNEFRPALLGMVISLVHAVVAAQLAGSAACWDEFVEDTIQSVTMPLVQVDGVIQGMALCLLDKLTADALRDQYPWQHPEFDTRLRAIRTLLS